MDTLDDIRGLKQDQKRLAARASEPCDFFEGASPKSVVCENCFWLHDEHPQFHATEAGGA